MMMWALVTLAMALPVQHNVVVSDSTSTYRVVQNGVPQRVDIPSSAGVIRFQDHTGFGIVAVSRVPDGTFTLDIPLGPLFAGEVVIVDLIDVWDLAWGHVDWCSLEVYHVSGHQIPDDGMLRMESIPIGWLPFTVQIYTSALEFSFHATIRDTVPWNR